ncbi:MAG: hypothetical protein IPG71_13515 [bacterium]|nr:hypothetical protein [bacterium]
MTLYEFPFGPCTGNTIITNYGHYGASQQLCVTDTSLGNFYLRVTPVDITQLQDSVLYDYEVFVECTPVPCLPAQNLVVAPVTGVPNAFQLQFVAPQPGIYTVYKTTDPNQVGQPPAAGWTSLIDYTAAVSSVVDIYLTDQFDAYAVYVVVHTCQ